MAGRKVIQTGRQLALCGCVVVLLLGGAVALYLGDYFPSPEELANLLRASGAWAPVAVIVLMVVHSFVPFPAEILALCAGAVFGTLLGSALVWVGAMLGALLAFGLSRQLGQAAVLAWLPPKQAEKLDHWTKEQGAVSLLISRFIPVIAFNLINYAAGLTRVPVWTFIWTTGLGIIPITVLTAYLGAQMKTLSWPLLLTVSAVGIALVWALHRLAKAKRWV